MTSPIAIKPLNAFDTLVERLIAAAGQGEDFYQDAISAGLDMVDVDTRIRFCCGDIACLIGSSYGQDRMGEWAKHIKRARSSVYEYAAMSRFYPREMREAWLNEPAISWSHMRRAMRTKSLEAAVELLDRAAEGAWSCEELDLNMAQEGKVTQGRKVFEGIVTIESDVKLWDGDIVDVTPHSRLLTGDDLPAFDPDRRYRVIVYEVAE